MRIFDFLLSLAGGLILSLYHFFNVHVMWPKCSWWADVTMWVVMILEGATHLKLIGPPSYNLNSYKRLTYWAPLLTKVVWPFLCTVVREAHFSFYANFNFHCKLWAKPFLKISLPHLLLYGNGLPFVENHWGNVYITLHTHKKKNQIKHSMKTTESSL